MLLRNEKTSCYVKCCITAARVRVYGRANVSSMAHAEYRYRLHVLHRQTKLGAMEGTPEPREIPWVCCLHGDPVQVRYRVLLRSVQCPGGTFPQRSQGKRAVLANTTSTANARVRRVSMTDMVNLPLWFIRRELLPAHFSPRNRQKLYTAHC